MRDLVKSFAAVAWRSVFSRRAKPSQWSVSTAAEQQDTAVSSPQQHSSVAAETDREIARQTGSVDPLLGVPGVADDGDAHPLVLPLAIATDGAAGTGHNPFAEIARQACQDDTATNGSSVSPAKTEVPDFAVPQIEDDIGEQSFAAGVDLAVPHIEDGIGEQSLAAGVDLAVFHIEDSIGEQSCAAGVEQHPNSVLLEDASSVKITRDELESFGNRGLRRAQVQQQEKQRKVSDRTVRTAATQSKYDRRKVKDALGVQKPQGVKNPHDNELFRIGCSQRSLQKEQERLADIKLQITAIEAKRQICQAIIEAPTLPPEELLKAQEGLKAMAAELKSLQMQLSKAEASKNLEAKASKTTGAPVNDEAPAASDTIMAVHTKAAQAPTKKTPPKSFTAKPKEQPEKPPLSKRQLAAHAAQAKPKQVRWKPQTTEDFLRVVADHESAFQPKSKPEAEAPQEMTAEELEGLAELIEFNLHHYPDLFKSQKKAAKPARKQAPTKSTPVLSAEQAALQSITALYDVLVQAWQAEMKTRPAQIFIHSLASNRGPHMGLMFLLPRMDEMQRPHEVMKIDFHTPAIIRNGRTLAGRDVVDILRVYIAVLHRIVGHFLPAEGVTAVTGRGVRTGARTFKAVGAELKRLKAEGVFISHYHAHPDEGAYTIFIKPPSNPRQKAKQ